MATSTHDNPTFWQRHRFTRSITVRRRIGDASYFSLNNLAGTAGAISPTYEYLSVSPLRPVPAVVCELSEPRICPTKTDRPPHPSRSVQRHLDPIVTNIDRFSPTPSRLYERNCRFLSLQSIHEYEVAGQSHPSASLRCAPLAGGVERDTGFPVFDHRLFCCY
jgi:hypothetical protein